MTADTAYHQQVCEAFPELEDFADTDLRDKVIEAWIRGLKRGGWRDINDIPYAWNIHEVTNVEHIRGTTQIAEVAAELQQDIHDADIDIDILRAACLLHDVGKCYEYVEYVDSSVIDDPDPRYATTVIPHSISGYALAHEVGCPLEVQRAIPHYYGDIPSRTIEAELVKSANEASSNAIIQSTMGMTLDDWIQEYSQVS